MTARLAPIVAGFALAAGSLTGCANESTVRPSGGDGSPAVTTTTTADDPSPSSPPAPPTIERAVVPAPALADNLLGDAPELQVVVWLPPSYSTSAGPYPVVYFLAGFDESASVAPIGLVLEEAIARDEAPEVVVVGVSGRNRLGGSFYVDSPVTGGWAQAVHHDLVAWVDARYRTIASPAGRVIAGFSMGGFGAFDLAMRHPDVFGAVYALSPGALAPGALGEMEMFADVGAVEQFLAMQSAVRRGDDPPPLSEGARFALAYGSAFAPDVDAGPPWVDYPFEDPDARPDPTVWARWEAGFGGIEQEVTEHRDALASLRGIALDVGLQDPYQWIPGGTQHLAEVLQAAGLPVRSSTYDGGHGPVSARVGITLVPFLEEVLAGE